MGAPNLGTVTGRVVLFGATGFTGELTARRLVADGARPLLVGRRETAVKALADELGGLDHDVADADRPDQLRSLLEPGDVLISTVGPFLRWGLPALRAAVDVGAHYLDCTGEPPFIRRVFQEFGPPALRKGVGVLTAIGYDYLPGNLAGALALQAARTQSTPAAPAASVQIGYFLAGQVGADSISSGTRASAAGVLLEPSFGWRGGRLVVERGAARVRRFDDGLSTRAGISIGGSEHFTLPRTNPGLDQVGVYLGWAGRASRAVQIGSAVGDVAFRLPGLRAGVARLVGRTPPSRSRGPGPQARADTGSLIVAEALDAAGNRLSRVVLRGPNPYDLTAGLLSWAAQRIAAGGLLGHGALGPVDAFGLTTLTDGAAGLGLLADP